MIHHRSIDYWGTNGWTIGSWKMVLICVLDLNLDGDEPVMIRINHSTSGDSWNNISYRPIYLQVHPRQTILDTIGRQFNTHHTTIWPRAMAADEDPLMVICGFRFDGDADVDEDGDENDIDMGHMKISLLIIICIVNRKL